MRKLSVHTGNSWTSHDYDFLKHISHVSSLKLVGTSHPTKQLRHLVNLQALQLSTQYQTNFQTALPYISPTVTDLTMETFYFVSAPLEFSSARFNKIEKLAVKNFNVKFSTMARFKRLYTLKLTYTLNTDYPIFLVEVTGLLSWNSIRKLYLTADNEQARAKLIRTLIFIPNLQDFHVTGGATPTIFTRLALLKARQNVPLLKANKAFNVVTSTEYALLMNNEEPEEKELLPEDGKYCHCYIWKAC